MYYKNFLAQMFDVDVIVLMTPSDFHRKLCFWFFVLDFTYRLIFFQKCKHWILLGLMGRQIGINYANLGKINRKNISFDAVKNCYLQNRTNYLQGRVLSICSHSKQSWQIWVKSFLHITWAHFWHWCECLFIFEFVSLCPWSCDSSMRSLQLFRIGLFGGILFGKSLPSPLSTRFPTTKDILFCMLLLSPLTDFRFTCDTTRDFTNSYPKPIELIFRGVSLLFMDQTVEAFIRLVSRT